MTGLVARDRWPVVAAAALLWHCGCYSAIRVDSRFDTRVASPAYSANPPRVLFDEAHRNFHTARGRYRPFVHLLANDGYAVVTNSAAFEEATLKGLDVLVIAGALGPIPTKDQAAFAESECDSVRDWVRSGGGLLLIVDHYPFGGSAADLAGRFGVGISRGITEDPVHSDPSSPYFLVFTRRGKLILEHPITEGRQPQERISRVMTFGGSSLEPPPSAVPFLRLSPHARDRAAIDAWERPGGRSPGVRYGNPAPAEGSAQAVALEFGRGRVVVLGEAGMLTAQLRGSSEPFGMNVDGIDNRQLALNVMHWLSGLLEPDGL